MNNGDFLILLAAMAVSSYFCRSFGFFAMRFVQITPRLEAALRATPLAVMSAIVAISVVRGGPPEWIASAAVVAIMHMTKSDIIAALGGVAVIALLRTAGA
ncbi:MAG: hypothetical protein FD175_1722 [Beijerinckiaceae bacterium]|nr:MAG: hypothetical protein FD175_1722 [Beijerinckiaceae bacterium]